MPGACGYGTPWDYLKELSLRPLRQLHPRVNLREREREPVKDAQGHCGIGPLEFLEDPFLLAPHEPLSHPSINAVHASARGLAFPDRTLQPLRRIELCVAVVPLRTRRQLPAGVVRKTGAGALSTRGENQTLAIAGRTGAVDPTGRFFGMAHDRDDKVATYTIDRRSGTLTLAAEVGQPLSKSTAVPFVRR